MLKGMFAPKASGGSTDPNWSSVVALLHFDGADGSTTFTDQTGRLWTHDGNAQLDTSQFKFGTASLLLDGTGDDLATPNDAGMAIGTQDYTLEMFWRPTVIGGEQTLFSSRYDVTGITFRQTASGALRFFRGNGSESVISATTLSAGTFYHVALERVSGQMTIYLDGTSIATVTSAGSHTSGNPSDPLYVGRHAVLISDYANGRIDEFRLTVGVARYNGNFTPPTEAFPNG